MRNPSKPWDTTSENLWGLHAADPSQKESHGGLVLPLGRRMTFSSPSWLVFLQ